MITRLTDPTEINQVVDVQRRRLRERGLPAEWAEPGIVFEDQYIRVVRDAVRFENLTTGTFIRIDFSNASAGGVVIIPRQGQRFLLVDHFRYATGESHLEFPRGFIEPNEGPADAALRELLEETGALSRSPQFLGRIYADNGLIGAPIYVYLADVQELGKPEGNESISRILWTSFSKLTAAIREGKINDGITLAASALLSSCLTP